MEIAGRSAARGGTGGTAFLRPEYRPQKSFINNNDTSVNACFFTKSNKKQQKQDTNKNHCSPSKQQTSTANQPTEKSSNGKKTNGATKLITKSQTRD